ncbi:MAG: right-handed parallel beta-helix repeat-containing protein [Holophagales bacterium]|nr:MAG: right-handed parallel beta-helix repeat-containing protein [Holophagales bacterium]
MTRAALLLLLPIARPALAGVVPVSTSAQLVAAIDAAVAGDVITLAPGTYAVAQSLLCDAPGTASAPIVVRAASPGTAEIRFDAVEGFKVSAPHWIFEDLVVRGVCALDDDCEHAFHLVGAADFTHIRNSRLLDFNAQVKGNGEGVPTVFPDDVVIEGCELANAAPRSTANPVTPIDVVGGRRWIVRANFIHDHQKAGGDQVSYAAFLKGNSRDGLFERNLVICERDHAGGVRLGLSFGGGGSGPDPICEDGVCSPEHQNGTMRNNLIVNCPQDVGIYLNEAFGTRLFHNTLIATTGIDVRFAASTAEIRGNLVSGSIRNRDGGTSTSSGNLTGVALAQFQAWFVDPLAADLTLVDGTAFVDQGTPLAAVPADYCANRRDDGSPDLGAVEYDGDGPCATALAGGHVDLFSDGLETGGTGAWRGRRP